MGGVGLSLFFFYYLEYFDGLRTNRVMISCLEFFRMGPQDTTFTF